MFSYFAATITCITKFQTELLGCKLSNRAHGQQLECASFTLDYVYEAAGDVSLKWPSHISVWALRMPAYDDFLSYADACRQHVGRWLSERSEHVVIRPCTSELVAYAEKFYACTKILCVCRRRPVRSKHAMHTLCERSARPRRGRRTLTERPQYADVCGQKCVNFTTSPLRVGSEFWTFCQRTICVLSAYAYRIKSIAHLLAFSLRALIICGTNEKRTRSDGVTCAAYA